MNGVLSRRTGTRIHRLGVEVFEAAGLRFEIEVGLRASASGSGETPGETGVEQQIGDSFGKSSVVAWRDKKGGFAFFDGFGDAGPAKGGDGQADGLGLA